MAFWNRKPPPAAVASEPERASFFSTDPFLQLPDRASLVQAVSRAQFRITPADMVMTGGAAMDAAPGGAGLKARFALVDQGGIPDAQLAWYGGQTFIGYQVCAMLAQHWLISKACSMPARDALRQGYELKLIGADDAPDLLRFIEHRDKRMGLRRNLVEAVQFARIFGIRHVLFKVRNAPPGYYEAPFNLDAVRPGMYAGMSQIDPYWLNPELSASGAADPSAIDFYEPEFWQINGQRIHKSHFVILRGDPVADVLKPSYLYGGMSVPQKIYERVYAAERTANEAPLLTLSKRTRTYKTDLAKIMAKGEERVLERLQERSRLMNNYGTDLVDSADSVEHHETGLADLDATIMTQYQIVAAVANVPATKLLGTTPKGFNSSGDYEQDSYHEELETIQTHDMEPIIDRHHLMLMHSERPDMRGVTVQIAWEPVDSPTATEWADINLKKAQTDQTLAAAGAIDGMDVRERLQADKNSGYQGLADVEAAPVVEGGGIEATAGQVAEPAMAAESGSLQQEALNGAQVDALQELIMAVSAGSLPRERAAALIRVAFPLVPESEIGRMLPPDQV